MQHLKRNLILIFIVDALILIGCLTLTFQKFALHPQMTLGLILLLIFDFIILSTFVSLTTVAVQYIARKIKKRRQKERD